MHATKRDHGTREPFSQTKACEACCRVGKELSSPLVATLVGLLFSNLGIIGGPKAAGVYSVVNSFILPLAIPLLLFSADLRSGPLRLSKLCI
jgi:uncharacterized membrane protein